MNWTRMRPEDLDGHRFHANTVRGATFDGTLRIRSPHTLKDEDDLAVILYMTPDHIMHLNEQLITTITTDPR